MKQGRQSAAKTQKRGIRRWYLVIASLRMGAPNAVFTLALLSYFPLTAWCFSRFGPRRGMLVALFGGWLFLPTFHNSDLIPLIKSKAILVGAGVLTMSLLFDFDRWSQFRPKLVDVPILLYGVVPFASAMSNGHGAYEATSAMFEALMAWVAPYLLGRLYLRDHGAVSELALAFVLSALVYVPLALWEIRMSPQIHVKLYGYFTFDFIQSIRFGGYRPSVFMQHGLMLGLFMACATLVAWWLWRTGARRTIGGRPFSWIVGILAVTTLLCKSTGASSCSLPAPSCSRRPEASDRSAGPPPDSHAAGVLRGAGLRLDRRDVRRLRRGGDQCGARGLTAVPDPDGGHADRQGP